MSAGVEVDLESRIPDVRRLRPRLLRLVERQPTPCYVFDGEEACRNLARYQRAFAAEGLDVRIHYAMKSNPYAGLCREVVAAGHGLDASSARELRIALDAGAERILLTGPGKSDEDLALALEACDRVCVMVDSAEEIRRLGRLAGKTGRSLRCGLRIVTAHQQHWNKFGVPLEELGAIWRLAARYPRLRLEGLHFHSGSLSSPRPVSGTLRELATALGEQLPARALRSLRFVDMGGGIAPEAFEGLYPWNTRQSMRFGGMEKVLRRILADDFRPSYLPVRVLPVEVFARKIAAAFRRYLLPVVPELALWAEPGKYISHSVMHLLFSVVELKRPDCLIVDAGTHMLGWEKYEFFDYAPIFNLSAFAPEKERPTLVYGNLCTPHDLFGYYLRARSLRPGHLLLLPFQGAYTYTLAQNFIRPIPPVVELS